MEINIDRLLVLTRVIAAVTGLEILLYILWLVVADAICVARISKNG